jgi:septum formation protein
MTLVLASASPARLRTLRAAGIDPEVLVSGVDESIVESTSAATLCTILARLKAEAVVIKLRQHGPRPNVAPRPDGSLDETLVLGCDSMLEFDGEILGKPVDLDDAMRRWERMRGKSGTLHTGHCLVRASSGERAEAVASAVVRFADVTDAEAAAYVATGEPLHVAGAFTIDGLGGWFIDGIDGDPGTVIGVSLPTLRRLLSQLGTGIDQLWPAALTSGP